MKQAYETTRRAFLEAATGLTATALWPRVAAAGGRVSRTVPFVGENRFPLEVTFGAGLGQRRILDLARLSGDQLVIPQDRFFIRTGAPDRLPAAAAWKVRMHGLVQAPLEIEAAELQRQAGDQGVHLLECAGNSRALHFGLMSAARWTGVPLGRVLERVRPLARATQVLISGFDEHAVEDAGSVPGASWIFGLDPIRASGAFLATGMNGAALRPEHGFPLRLVVPGWYACTAIKWVNEIAFVDDDAPATDHMREYAGRTHQDPVGPRDLALGQAGRRPEGPPLARDFQPASIDPAALPVRVEEQIDAEGRIAYRVVGIEWGGVTPVADLRIRFDAEQDWTSVEGTGRVAAGTWSLWSHSFRPKRPGRYRIELQVTGASVRTRRLDAGYYTREIEIESV